MWLLRSRSSDILETRFLNSKVDVARRALGYEEVIWKRDEMQVVTAYRGPSLIRRAGPRGKDALLTHRRTTVSPRYIPHQIRLTVLPVRSCHDCLCSKKRGRSAGSGVLQRRSTDIVGQDTANLG